MDYIINVRSLQQLSEIPILTVYRNTMLKTIALRPRLKRLPSVIKYYASSNFISSLLVSRRNYGVRSEFDSPFDHLPKTNKPFISWKATSVFLLFGAYLAYDETLYDWYYDFTHADETNSLTAIQLEYRLKNLPIYQKLTKSSVSDKWVKLETWENLDRSVLENHKTVSRAKHEEEYTKKSLTNSILAQPGGILIKPVIFHNVETDEGVTIVHAGYRLCGYPFMIHGGMIATLLNETFKRNASLCGDTSSSLKEDFMVENLTISYKRPSIANQFFVVKTRKKDEQDNDPKSVALESVIESQNGKVLVKGEAVLRDTGRASGLMENRHRSRSKWFSF